MFAQQEETGIFKPYWASVSEKDIADEILDKVDRYYKYLSLSGRLDLYRRSWAYYYRPRLTGARLNPTGEQGELTALSVNQYRNLLLHLETMTTQVKPAWECGAVNSDVKSQAQTILGKGLLDYYMKEKLLSRNFQRATKSGLTSAEGFIQVGWNATAGDKYGRTITGAIQYQGDVQYKNYHPIDVIRDFTLQDPDNQDWYILRTFENKYTLAAKFKDIQKQILEDSIDMLELARTTTLNALALEDSDNVMVYTLIHKPTPALPQGRYTSILDNGTVMLNGPLPYEHTHVYRLAPDEEEGTIFGYTVGYDLLSVQEGLDILYSTAMSNQATYGIQNILAPKGHDISTSQFAGGMNLMEYDPKIGKPEALNLTSTPPEIFQFMQMLEKIGETLSGVNSVARGNPEASLKSGAALALVQSMAIQFSMGLQSSYAELLGRVGTATIDILKNFASVPRVAMIAGKSNRSLMKYFSGNDLASINRVYVDMGNPMTNTIAGRVNLADQLLDKNMIADPDQYLTVLTTGRYEPAIQSKQAESLLIKAENEGLGEGIPQRVIATDEHVKHINEHRIVIANTDIRQDPNNPIMIATLDHINEHMQALKFTDPTLLALIHQQSLALPPNLAPQSPKQNPNEGGNPGAIPKELNATNPVTQEAGEVNMPNMPNPPAGTDERSAEIINQQKGQ